jgi:hypothetical protein
MPLFTSIITMRCPLHQALQVQHRTVNGAAVNGQVSTHSRLESDVKIQSLVLSLASIAMA